MWVEVKGKRINFDNVLSYEAVEVVKSSKRSFLAKGEQTIYYYVMITYVTGDIQMIDFPTTVYRQILLDQLDYFLGEPQEEEDTEDAVN